MSTGTSYQSDIPSRNVIRRKCAFRAPDCNWFQLAGDEGMGLVSRAKPAMRVYPVQT